MKSYHGTVPRIVLQKGFEGRFYVKEGCLVIRTECGSKPIFFTVNKSVLKIWDPLYK
jgi:hypothetical protein